jgi:glycosyltransferase involved in cell wall biosynthesis
MKILILDPYPDRPWRISKDTIGGYGTANRFGDGLVSRAITWVMAREVDWAPLRTGFGMSTGDIELVQDADLEYDPNEYPKLLEPILSGKADIVYGSRFRGGDSHRVLYFWHYLGNKFITLCSNMFTNLNLSDVETCFKVFKGDIIRSMEIKENRFGFELEITVKFVGTSPLRTYSKLVSAITAVPIKKVKKLAGGMAFGLFIASSNTMYLSSPNSTA